MLRGAPCAKGAGSDPQKVLAACRIDDPSLASPDVPASGRDAERVMDAVDKVLK